MTDAADLGYGEAMSELEGILEEIERNEVDVDVLATKVARAAELIAVCRDRIAGARTEVERVVVELEEADGAGQPEDGGSRATGA